MIGFEVENDSELEQRLESSERQDIALILALLSHLCIEVAKLLKEETKETRLSYYFDLPLVTYGRWQFVLWNDSDFHKTGI